MGSFQHELVVLSDLFCQFDLSSCVLRFLRLILRSTISLVGAGTAIADVVNFLTMDFKFVSVLFIPYLVSYRYRKPVSFSCRSSAFVAQCDDWKWMMGRASGPQFERDE